MNRTLKSFSLNVSPLVVRWAPGLRLLHGYERAWLRPDLVAAASVCAVLIPSAMAYGELAGLRPVAGLYAALFAMVAYAVFGSSRHLIVGPEAGTAILVASVLAPLAGGDAGRYAAMAAMLALIAGAFLLLAGLARLGFVADYLSRPVLIGYMNGVVLVMVMGQAGRLFGITVKSETFLQQLWELVTDLPRAHLLTLGMGLVTVACLLLLRRFTPRTPAALMVVVVSIVLSAILGLQKHGVAVVGEVPAGLPGLKFPLLGFLDFGSLVPGALSIALLTFPDSVLTAKGFARKNGYEIDANQELIALGANDVVAGMFQGFPVGASSSRTAVNDAAGGRTRLVGLLAAVVLIVFLLFLTPLVAPLPRVTLAAIIIVAAVGLFDVHTVRELFRVHRWSGWLAISTTVGVLALGMVQAILVAVILSLFYVISRISRPHDAVLGKVGGLEGFHDIEEHEDSQVVPGLVVYRFDAQLFFANASYFVERCRELIDAARVPVRWLLVDAEAMPSIDPTAVEELRVFHAELRDRGVVLALARANTPLRRMLKRTGLVSAIGEDRFFPSVRSGVEAFLQTDMPSGG